jgi:zinc and cadmium transporter
MNYAPIIAAFFHCIVILAVGAVPLTWRLQGQIFDALLSFGAGVLLSAAFLHMMPTAIEALGESTGLFLLLGYLLMLVLEKFTMAHPCGEEACPNHRLGYTALFGLSVHSIISGIALGVGLGEAEHVSVSLALLAAILVHKVPETLALMGLLAGSGWNKKKILFALVVFSLMGPIGIFVGSILNLSGHWTLSSAMAVSAGTFLYIASSDLLPQLHKKMKQEWLHFVAFLFGLASLAFEAAHQIFY